MYLNTAHSGLIDSECILKLKKLLERLPHSNYLMLRYLMKHLLKVSKHAGTSLCDVSSVCNMYIYAYFHFITMTTATKCTSHFQISYTPVYLPV